MNVEARARVGSRGGLMLVCAIGTGSACTVDSGLWTVDRRQRVSRAAGQYDSETTGCRHAGVAARERPRPSCDHTSGVADVQ